MKSSFLTSKSSANSLKADCLSFHEVLAQSFAVIAPTTIPASNLGLIVALAGNGTWLSFVIGLLGLLCVGFNINQFASRSASPGSLYTYIVKGLGSRAGIICGCSLVLAYLFTGMSVLCGFANLSGMILGHLGLHPSSISLLALGAAIAWFAAYRDIQLSSLAMMSLEGLSIILILILGLIIWANSGFIIDFRQLTLEGVTPGNIATSLVLVMFAFSGFESATSLGDEAKQPLKTIPKAVLGSTLMAGVFFVLMTYIETLGFHQAGLDISKSEEPLNVLAQSLGVSFLGDLVALGTLLSFFSCILGSINPAARIWFTMAQHGLFHTSLGYAHHRNRTPHIAVTLCSIIMFAVPALMLLFNIKLFEGMGYLGAFCSYGFLTVYILISIAAPIYLYKLQRLKFQHTLVSALAIGLMGVPILGSIGIPNTSIFPVPEAPYNLFPYLFGLYLWITYGWIMRQQKRLPHLLKSIQLSHQEIQVPLERF